MLTPHAELSVVMEDTFLSPHRRFTLLTGGTSFLWSSNQFFREREISITAASVTFNSRPTMRLKQKVVQEKC